MKRAHDEKISLWEVSGPVIASASCPPKPFVKLSYPLLRFRRPRLVLGSQNVSICYSRGDLRKGRGSHTEELEGHVGDEFRHDGVGDGYLPQRALLENWEMSWLSDEQRLRK